MTQVTTMLMITIIKHELVFSLSIAPGDALLEINLSEVRLAKLFLQRAVEFTVCLSHTCPSRPATDGGCQAEWIISLARVYSFMSFPLAMRSISSAVGCPFFAT